MQRGYVQGMYCIVQGVYFMYRQVLWSTTLNGMYRTVPFVPGRGDVLWWLWVRKFRGRALRGQDTRDDIWGTPECWLFWCRRPGRDTKKSKEAKKREIEKGRISR